MKSSHYLVLRLKLLSENLTLLGYNKCIPDIRFLTQASVTCPKVCTRSLSVSNVFGKCCSKDEQASSVLLMWQRVVLRRVGITSQTPWIALPAAFSPECLTSLLRYSDGRGGKKRSVPHFLTSCIDEVFR